MNLTIPKVTHAKFRQVKETNKEALEKLKQSTQKLTVKVEQFGETVDAFTQAVAKQGELIKKSPYYTGSLDNTEKKS